MELAARHKWGGSPPCFDVVDNNIKKTKEGTPLPLLGTSLVTQW